MLAQADIRPLLAAIGVAVSSREAGQGGVDILANSAVAGAGDGADGDSALAFARGAPNPACTA